MKVQNMESTRGNTIANQFILTDDNGNKFFQSYRSIIAKEDNEGNVILDAFKWNYSKTTGKYRNIFLGEDKKTTERKIKKGIYKLENLNG